MIKHRPRFAPGCAGDAWHGTGPNVPRSCRPRTASANIRQAMQRHRGGPDLTRRPSAPVRLVRRTGRSRHAVGTGETRASTPWSGGERERTVGRYGRHARTGKGDGRRRSAGCRDNRDRQRLRSRPRHRSPSGHRPGWGGPASEPWPTSRPVGAVLRIAGSTAPHGGDVAIVGRMPWHAGGPLSTTFGQSPRRSPPCTGWRSGTRCRSRCRRTAPRPTPSDLARKNRPSRQRTTGRRVRRLFSALRPPARRPPAPVLRLRRKTRPGTADGVSATRTGFLGIGVPRSPRSTETGSPCAPSRGGRKASGGSTGGRRRRPRPAGSRLSTSDKDEAGLARGVARIYGEPRTRPAAPRHRGTDTAGPSMVRALHDRIGPRAVEFWRRQSAKPGGKRCCTWRDSVDGVARAWLWQWGSSQASRCR